VSTQFTRSLWYQI